MTPFDKLLAKICVKNGFSLAEVRGYRKNLRLVRENLPRQHHINVANRLSSAFPWQASPQGHKYWSSINKRILAAENPRDKE